MEVTQMLSIQPSRIVLYNQYWRGVSEDGTPLSNLSYMAQINKMMKAITPVSPVTRAFHGFELSNNAIRTMRRRINWLYMLSKPKNIISPNGKKIRNFRLSFLTFTLPSKQVHPTSVITSQLWNHFLTDIRRSTGMQNYVWRLEFQKNGNVHYHLVSDTFIRYQHALRVWNRVANKLGYVDAYSERMKSMTSYEYHGLFKNSKNYNFSETESRYIENRKTGWKVPNSVDVKSVKSADAIGGYISKYFSKSADGHPVCNPLDNEDNSQALRLWYSSQSLSKLKALTYFREELPYDLYGIIKAEKEAREFVMDYSKMLIFDLKKLSVKLGRWLYNRLSSYAFDTGYSPHIQKLQSIVT